MTHIESNLHARQPVIFNGTPLEEARGAVILLHGRGASAEDIIGLGYELGVEGLALIAPQAAGNAWYPHPFWKPAAVNEPWLSSALGVVGDLIQKLAAAGVPVDRTALAGFSQGACLALEYAARNPQRYGAVFGLSGGLIGEAERAEQTAGSFDGTPVLLGCSDVDPYIPLERVNSSAAVLAEMGADVDRRIYSGMGHTVNDDELQAMRAILQTWALP